MNNNFRLPSCAKGDFFAEALITEFNSGESVQNELTILVDTLFYKKDYAENLRIIAESIEVDPMGYCFGPGVKKIAEQIRKLY